MAQSSVSIEEYTKTYTSFSGCDIVASFNGAIIGELQAITYSVSREKAPIYTLGSPEPRSFSRGKRGIAGTLVFTVFDRDALISEFNKWDLGTKIQKFKANTSEQDGTNTIGTNNFNPLYSIDTWDAEMNGTDLTQNTTVNDLVTTSSAAYADEILPFDITISFANEYGQRASLTIFGVELLNEGSGYSIDSVTTEKAYTFIARRISRLEPVTSQDGGILYSTNENSVSVANQA